MLTPKNIIYGFCQATHPPKYKYLISLFRNETLHVVACFTISKNRSGAALGKSKHGANRNFNDEIVSYVFKANTEIGDIPNSIQKFSFPLETAIRFDYGLMDRNQDEIIGWFKNPKVVGILSDDEYENLLYAMIQSDDVPKKYQILFDEALRKIGQKNARLKSNLLSI